MTMKNWPPGFVDRHHGHRLQRGVCAARGRRLWGLAGGATATRPTSSNVVTNSSNVAPRLIPSWLQGRCCGCLAPEHCAADCRDPLRCSCCMENGHFAHGCRNPWHFLSSLACFFVTLVSHPGIMHRLTLASCESTMASALPSKVFCHWSWALVVSATTSLATPVRSGVVVRSG